MHPETGGTHCPGHGPPEGDTAAGARSSRCPELQVYRGRTWTLAGQCIRPENGSLEGCEILTKTIVLEVEFSSLPLWREGASVASDRPTEECPSDPRGKKTVRSTGHDENRDTPDLRRGLPGEPRRDASTRVAARTVRLLPAPDRAAPGPCRGLSNGLHRLRLLPVPTGHRALRTRGTAVPVRRVTQEQLQPSSPRRSETARLGLQLHRRPELLPPSDGAVPRSGRPSAASAVRPSPRARLADLHVPLELGVDHALLGLPGP